LKAAAQVFRCNKDFLDCVDAKVEVEVAQDPEEPIKVDLLQYATVRIRETERTFAHLR